MTYKLTPPEDGEAVPYITKGTRVLAHWLGNAKAVSLAGAQMKLQVREFVVTGTVRHLRGDHPTEPTKIDLYIEPEGMVDPDLRQERPEGCTCEGHDRLVVVDMDHVLKVLR